MIYLMTNVKYSRESIVERMRCWHDITGCVPCTVVWGRRAHARQDLVALHRLGGYPTAQTVARVFGTWRAAVEAAGYEAAKPWTRERIVASILAWRRAHGRWPRSVEWRRQDDTVDIGMDRPALQTVIDHFGSWRAGLRAAGYDHSAYMGWWDQNSIIDALRAWHGEHGRIPSNREWMWASKTHPSMLTVRNHFGTWKAAVVAAGFEPRAVGQHIDE